MDIHEEMRKLEIKALGDSQAALNRILWGWFSKARDSGVPQDVTEARLEIYKAELRDYGREINQLMKPIRPAIYAKLDHSTKINSR